MAKNVQNLSRLGVKKGGGALIGGGALNGEFMVCVLCFNKMYRRHDCLILIFVHCRIKSYFSYRHASLTFILIRQVLTYIKQFT